MRRQPTFKNVTRRDPSLGKIIALLLFLFAVVYGGLWITETLRGHYFVGSWESKAHAAIEDARQLMEEQRSAEVRELLAPIVARVSDSRITPEALFLLAKAEQAAGNVEQAETYLKRAISEFPNSPHHPKAALACARLLEENGDMEQALALYDEVRDTAAPEFRAEALTAFGRQAEREGELWEARDYYAKALEDAEWNSEAWGEALDGLGEANVELIFSSRETPESRYYEVQSGDNLTKIGVELNTTQGLLMRANNMEDPSNLRVGQRLKHTPKDFRIVIERSTRRLFLLDNDGIFKRYEVGLGRPGQETVLGSYRVGNKQKDPAWFKPGHGVIPANDPRNELATRWMPMVPEEEGLPTDLGIHGTIAPETIGEYDSNGCVRMYTEEVEELYDLVVRATPVEVVEVFSPA
ncbi:MAG: L,D-transpeptidase family protein [Candidatus Hydrogenedentota bacterium]